MAFVPRRMEPARRHFELLCAACGYCVSDAWAWATVGCGGGRGVSAGTVGDERGAASRIWDADSPPVAKFAGAVLRGKEKMPLRVRAARRPKRRRQYKYRPLRGPLRNALMYLAYDNEAEEDDDCVDDGDVESDREFPGLLPSSTILSSLSVIFVGETCRI